MSILITSGGGIVTLGGGVPRRATVEPTLQHGEPLTITGSGFGSHADFGGTSPYLCNAFTRFDGWNTTLAEETRDNYVLYKDPSDATINSNLLLTATNKRSDRHSYCLRHTNRGDDNLHRAGLRYDFTSWTDQYFCSFWFRVNNKWSGGKHSRLFRTANGDTIILNHVATSGTITEIQPHINLYFPSLGGAQTSIWATPWMPVDTWFRMDMLVDRRSGANNRFTMQQDGQIPIGSGSNLGVPLSFVGAGKIPTDFISNEWAFAEEIPGTPFIGDDGTEVEWFVCDPYCSQTLARVELGNAPVLADCTHLEIQLPTAWADDSITIEGNAGSFADGTTAYLHVIDATNTVVKTQAVTVGAVSGSEPPPSGTTLLGVFSYTDAEFVGVERNQIQCLSGQVAAASGTPAVFKFYNRSNASVGRKVKFAIYSNTHTQLLAETEEFTSTGTSGDGWVSLAFTGSPAALQAGTTYEVMAWFEGSSGTYDTVRLNTSTLLGNGVNWGSQAYGATWPTSPTVTGWSNIAKFAYEVVTA